MTDFNTEADLILITTASEVKGRVNVTFTFIMVRRQHYFPTNRHTCALHYSDL